MKVTRITFILSLGLMLSFAHAQAGDKQTSSQISTNTSLNDEPDYNSELDSDASTARETRSSIHSSEDSDQSSVDDQASTLSGSTLAPNEETNSRNALELPDSSRDQYNLPKPSGLSQAKTKLTDKLKPTRTDVKHLKKHGIFFVDKTKDILKWTSGVTVPDQLNAVQSLSQMAYESYNLIAEPVQKTFYKQGGEEGKQAYQDNKEFNTLLEKSQKTEKRKQRYLNKSIQAKKAEDNDTENHYYSAAQAANAELVDSKTPLEQSLTKSEKSLNKLKDTLETQKAENPKNSKPKLLKSVEAKLEKNRAAFNQINESVDQFNHIHEIGLHQLSAKEAEDKANEANQEIEESNLRAEQLQKKISPLSAEEKTELEKQQNRAKAKTLEKEDYLKQQKEHVAEEAKLRNQLSPNERQALKEREMSGSILPQNMKINPLATQKANRKMKQEMGRQAIGMAGRAGLFTAGVVTSAASGGITTVPVVLSSIDTAKELYNGGKKIYTLNKKLNPDGLQTYQALPGKHLNVPVKLENFQHLPAEKREIIAQRLAENPNLTEAELFDAHYSPKEAKAKALIKPIQKVIDHPITSKLVDTTASSYNAINSGLHGNVLGATVAGASALKAGSELVHHTYNETKPFIKKQVNNLPKRFQRKKPNSDPTLDFDTPENEVRAIASVPNPAQQLQVKSSQAQSQAELEARLQTHDQQVKAVQQEAQTREHQRHIEKEEKIRKDKAKQDAKKKSKFRNDELAKQKTLRQKAKHQHRPSLREEVSVRVY